MIYVPEYSSSNCAYVRNESSIRVYESVPTPGSTVSYRDYYVNSHYLYTDGQTTFSNYTTLPTCLSTSSVTTNFLYRNDLADICIVSALWLGLIWFLMSKLFKTLFRGPKLY